MKKAFIFIFVFIVLITIIPTVSSLCDINFDSTTYIEGELSEVDAICSSPNERTQPFTFTFTNSSGFVIFQVTGTTPSVKNTLFTSSFIINSTYVDSYGDGLNVSLTGTNLEGSDNATVIVATEESMIIIEIVESPKFLIRQIGALDFRLVDGNNNPVANSQCILDIVDVNDLPVSPSGGINPVPSQGDGKVLFSLFFDETFVKEGKAYKWDIACTCFNSTGITSSLMGICYNGETGDRIKTFRHAETQVPFIIDNWLTVNTIVDKLEYVPRNTIFITANVSNLQDEDLSLHIFNLVRCSAGEDNPTDTDRSLIITDGFDYDRRRISANSTQTQSKEFIIPEIRHLEGRSSECYATTETWVIDGTNNKIKGYTTTSPVFNITSDTLNLPADWLNIDSDKFLAIINLSSPSYLDWNGIGNGNIDIVLNNPSGEDFDAKDTRSSSKIDFNSFLIERQIKEIIIWNATHNISFNLEFLEDGKLEIEILNQDMSRSGWYNITIEFENFEQRMTKASEITAGAKKQNTLTKSSFFNGEQINNLELIETTLMKFYINILRLPDYGNTYKIIYNFFPRNGNGELVDSIETEVSGIGNKSIFLRSTDLNPDSLNETYEVQSLVSIRNADGLWEDFTVTPIGNITIISINPPEGGVSGEGIGTAGLYDVIIGLLADRYGIGQRVDAEIKITNTGDLPDEDTLLIYFLTDKDGREFGRTKEQILEVPPGTTIFSKNIVLPSNAIIGEWKFNVEYHTVVQPVIKVFRSFEVVEKLSFIESLTSSIRDKRVIVLASSISLGLIIIIILILIASGYILKKNK